MSDLTQEMMSTVEGYYYGVVGVLPRIALGLIVSFLLYYLLKSIRSRLTSYFSSKADDQLLIDFSSSIITTINGILIALTFLWIIGQTGVATSLLGAAGITAFVVGFAFKDIGENLLAGMMMAFKRPFHVGDVIETKGIAGTILSMSLRDTHLKTFDGKDVYIPNGQIINNPLYNFTQDGYIRMDFNVGVDYDSNISLTRQMIMDELKKVPGILLEEKAPTTHIEEFGPNTIDIQVRFWIDTHGEYSGLEVKSEAMTNILQRLHRENIRIPREVIEIKNYQDNPIRTRA